MPRTHGNNVVPFSRIHAFIATDRPLHEHQPEPESATDARIGEIVAELVDHGSTLQVGIGGIPDAVLARLCGKHDLGIHTEMFSDRVIDLVESGAVTNRHKVVGRGRIVTSFINGTRRLFDFVNDNPLVAFYPCDWTNDTSVIRQNPKVVAINSAIQIDLTGQVCADSIGHRIYSGIGGQMDFIRGAALSKGGKAVIALPVDRGRRAHVAHRRAAHPRGRRRDDARPRPLGRDRIRRRQPAREKPARARSGPDLDRSPRFPRRASAPPDRGAPLSGWRLRPPRTVRLSSGSWAGTRSDPQMAVGALDRPIDPHPASAATPFRIEE